MNKCQNCYFEGMCDLDECEGYYPINEFEDDDLDETIERNRKEYYDAWQEYIKGYADD